MTQPVNDEPGQPGVNQPGSRLRPLTAIEQQQIEDLKWAGSAAEVQQHLGKYVVVHKKRVVAVGTDCTALLQEAAAREQCPEWELVVEVVPAIDAWEVPH
jgi:hypothetical protein